MVYPSEICSCVPSAVLLGQFLFRFRLFGDENGYYPMLYVADLLNREKDLVEVEI